MTKEARIQAAEAVRDQYLERLTQELDATLRLLRFVQFIILLIVCIAIGWLILYWQAG